MSPRLALLVFSLPALLLAQTNLRVVAHLPSGSMVAVTGGSVLVQSDGREVNVNIVATNVGNTAITINQVSVSGADFTLATGAGIPATLQPGGASFFGIRYSPTTSSSVAQVSINYTEGSQSRSVAFGLSGVAPSFSFAFVAPDGSRTPVTPGGRLSFGLTRVNTPQSGTLVILNSGSATGTINQVAVTGRDFAASLSVPAGIPANQEVGIPVVFSPQARGTSSGSVTVDLGFRTVSFALDGTGALPEYVTAYVLRVDGNVRPLTNGGRLTFAPVAATTTDTADVVVANQGNGNGTVRSVTLSGNGFELVNLPLVPATIPPGQSFRFGVQFSPRQLGSYSGSLRIELDDRTIAVTIEASTSDPDFSLLYLDPASRNMLPLTNGGTLAFAGTDVNSTAAYTVILRNTGSGTGFLTSISVSGDGFQLADLPSLPATVNATQELRFSVQFTPRQRESHRGSLQVQLTTGTISVSLTGLGTAPSFLYETADPDSDFVPYTRGTELSFSAAVGQTFSKTFRLNNIGNAEAVVSAISVSGAGFQLVNVPFLPLTIPVNGDQTFTVTFAPTQPGRVQGRLRVGNDTIDLAGTGLAARLEFAYSNEAGTTDVAENGVIVFSPARVAESSQIEVSVENTGTTALAISTIDVSSAASVFSPADLPVLPFSLEPGDTFRFPVRFIPNNTGTLNGSLRINNSQFTLSGVGRQPVPLPEYRLDGPAGVQQPLQQPSVSLTLASPYSLGVRGTLTLAFLSDVFADDPAIQLASGGRSIGFTIPANSTRAVFDNGLDTVRLQTGSVAGAIQLRPAFATNAGLDLTPANPPSLTMTIERAAPRLLRAAIGSVSANTIELIVTGYSTTRTLREATVQVTPQPGERLTSGSVSLNVESTALAWFQSGQSQGFGGLFSLSIPIVLQRGDSQENLVQRIQSFSITITNELGTSNALTVP
jgi:hypothetical protein